MFKKAFFIYIIILLSIIKNGVFSSEEPKYKNLLKKYKREVTVKTEKPEAVLKDTTPTTPLAEKAKDKIPESTVVEAETKTFRKRNSKWVKKDQTKNNDDIIRDVENVFLCSDIEDISLKYKDMWNCQQINEFKISTKNTFNCKSLNLIIEINALSTSPDESVKGGIYSKFDVFLQPDGLPLLENEQFYSNTCEYLRRSDII